LERKVEFRPCFRRYALCLRKEPKQGGIALFYSGNRPCGVFPIAKVVLGVGQACKRKAHLQVSPDEIKANSINIVPQGRPSVETTHVQIIGVCGFEWLWISSTTGVEAWGQENSVERTTDDDRHSRMNRPSSR
jgi:hypothetical protein